MKAFLVILVLLALPALSAVAQDDVCPVNITEAVTTAADACAGLAPNQLCLGYPRLDAVINCDEAPSLNAPGDSVPVDIVCFARFSPLQDAGTWGIGVMTVTPIDSDQSATFVLFGDVEIQNQASAFSALQVYLTAETPVYDGPGSQYAIVDTLAEGATAQTNACNCTGNWLRILQDDGRVGWITARTARVLGDSGTLPVARADTPVYASMQAFTLRTGAGGRTCAGAPENGLLVQVAPGADPLPLQINGIEVTLTATAFIQSQPGDRMTIEVLDGSARVTADGFTATVPAGARAVIPTSESNIPQGLMQVEPYGPDDVADLPMALLPHPVDPVAALGSVMPQVVGVEPCAVVSDRGDTRCRVHFVNPDGDAITRLDVTFVRAPQGDWTGSIKTDLPLLAGTSGGGVLPWDAACSLGAGGVFIGPVEWSITITDAAGHVSEPFATTFNCVPG